MLQSGERVATLAHLCKVATQLLKKMVASATHPFSQGNCECSCWKCLEKKKAKLNSLVFRENKTDY